MHSKWFYRSVALVAAFAATAAYADQGTLTVKASIIASCKIANVPDMVFSLDPTTTGAGTATSGVTYRCTKGITPPTLTVGGVAAGTTTYSSGLTNALVGPGTDKLQYTITWTNPTTNATGLGTATPDLVNLNGSIANAQFVNATAGSYSGTVAVNITP